MKNDAFSMALLFDYYGELLTQKQRSYFDLYYNQDFSLAEIAENQSITRQGVRDSLKRAEAQMREMEERLQLAGRFREMRDGFDAICQAAQTVRTVNEQSGNVREIGECAGRIIELAAQLRER